MKRIIILTVVVSVLAWLVVSCGEDNKGVEGKVSDTWQTSLNLGVDCRFNAVCETNDGYLMWLGYGRQDEWDTTSGDSVHLNQQGVLLVQTTFGGYPLKSTIFGDSVSDEYGTDVIAASDGGVVVLGNYTDDGGDVWLRKVTPSGQVEWEVINEVAPQEVLRRVTASADGGYVICGSCFATAGRGWDYLAAKVSSIGQLEWVNFSTDTTQTEFWNALALEDSSYLFVGSIAAHSGDGTDFLLSRRDASGSTLWTKRVDLGGFDIAMAARALDSTGFVIYGVSHADLNSIVILRTDLEGTTTRITRHSLVGGFHMNSMTVTPDSGLVACGYLDQAGPIEAYMVGIDSRDAFAWDGTYGLSDRIGIINGAFGSIRRGYVAAGQMASAPGALTWIPLMIRADEEGYAEQLMLTDSI